MDLMRRLLAVALVFIAAGCIVVWAVWFNPRLELFLLPVNANDFGDPMYGPIAAAMVCFFVAYFVHPRSPDKR